MSDVLDKNGPNENGIIVFTNGCFDLLHRGHLDLFERAKELGDRLIIGLNSDSSIRGIKGPERPLVAEEDRAAMLRSLRWVDEVIIFNEATPRNLIAQLQPDILVKGGDWPTEQIVGADIVLEKGGQVFSLPLREGYSTTGLVEHIFQKKVGDGREEKEWINSQKNESESVCHKALRNHIEVIGALSRDFIAEIEQIGMVLQKALGQGNKILLCGNGGSAADAQHIAAELVGRFEKDRKGLPAFSLATDTSVLSALGNDYGFAKVFARQIETLAQEGDVLIALSTSGNSENVLEAVMAAQKKACLTIGLTGKTGRRLSAICDYAILVPSEQTARIQEAHITIGHLWCKMIDNTALGDS
jgi:D-sedoheptulose 7-phosphate isomerase